MQLKTRDEILAEINALRGTQGVAAADDDVADDVLDLCSPVATMYPGVEAIPFTVIIALAMQLIPIIFGQGGFTIEKLQAVLQLILSIFTT